MCWGWLIWPICTDLIIRSLPQRSDPIEYSKQITTFRASFRVYLLIGCIGGPEKGPLGCLWKNLRLDLGAGLLGKKDSLDVGENAALGNGHAVQKFVQLFVVADGELKVAGDDPLLLVVPGSIAGKLKDLCGQVLHDGRQVDASSASGPLGVVTSLQKAVDPSDRKLEACALDLMTCPTPILPFAAFCTGAQNPGLDLR